MPKLTRLTDRERALADELQRTYGVSALTLVQVSKVIGVKSDNTARAWTRDLPYVMIGGRKKYMVSDVAKKIDSARVEP